MTDRHAARVLALQAMFQLEAQGAGFLEQLDAFLADESPPADVVGYARRLVLDTWGRREEYDAMVRGASAHWDVERMGAVDRNILRLSICEMTQRREVPEKVAMDEAIELAKEFGTAESAGFVNGVLDAVRKKLRGE